jgi:hypothetical protein
MGSWYTIYYTNGEYGFIYKLTKTKDSELFKGVKRNLKSGWVRIYSHDQAFLIL